MHRGTGIQVGDSDNCDMNGMPVCDSHRRRNPGCSLPGENSSCKPPGPLPVFCGHFAYYATDSSFQRTEDTRASLGILGLTFGVCYYDKILYSHATIIQGFRDVMLVLGTEVRVGMDALEMR